MSRSIHWWWPTLAGVATAASLVVGPDYALAVPAATVAVVAATLTLIEPLRRRHQARMASSYSPPLHVGSIREAFGGGEPGREDVLLTLDLLERKIIRPDLPARTGHEVAAIVRQPAAEFREYVHRRLDELEARS